MLAYLLPNLSGQKCPWSPTPGHRHGELVDLCLDRPADLVRIVVISARDPSHVDSNQGIPPCGGVIGPLDVFLPLVLGPADLVHVLALVDEGGEIDPVAQPDLVEVADFQRPFLGEEEVYNVLHFDEVVDLVRRGCLGVELVEIGGAGVHAENMTTPRAGAVLRRPVWSRHDYLVIRG